jgi:hypothetical protein
MGRRTGKRGRGGSKERTAGAYEFDPTDIFSALNAARVKYLVVGGIAAIQYGVPRATFDVDLAVQMNVSNLERMDQALRSIGFTPKVPASVVGLANPRTRKEWTESKQMKVFSYAEGRAPFRLIDIMVHPLKRFELLYRDRAMVSYGRITVPLVPLRTLVQLKTGTGRVQDQMDIQYLQAAQGVERERGRT